MVSTLADWVICLASISVLLIVSIQLVDILVARLGRAGRLSEGEKVIEAIREQIDSEVRQDADSPG